MAVRGPVTPTNDGTRNVLRSLEETSDYPVTERVRLFEGDLLYSAGTPGKLAFSEEIGKGEFVTYNTTGNFKSMASGTSDIYFVVKKITSSTDIPIARLITRGQENGEIPKPGTYSAGDYPKNYHQLREGTIMRLDVGAGKLQGYISNTSTSAALEVPPGSELALTGVYDKDSGMPQFKVAESGDWVVGRSDMGLSLPAAASASEPVGGTVGLPFGNIYKKA
jgi:hypothetical protein